MILFNKHQTNFNPSEKTSIHSLNEKKKGNLTKYFLF